MNLLTQTVSYAYGIVSKKPLLITQVLLMMIVASRLISFATQVYVIDFWLIAVVLAFLALLYIISWEIFQNKLSKDALNMLSEGIESPKVLLEKLRNECFMENIREKDKTFILGSISILSLYHLTLLTSVILLDSLMRMATQNQLRILAYIYDNLFLSIAIVLSIPFLLYFAKVEQQYQTDEWLSWFEDLVKRYFLYNCLRRRTSPFRCRFVQLMMEQFVKLLSPIPVTKRDGPFVAWTLKLPYIIVEKRLKLIIKGCSSNVQEDFPINLIPVGKDGCVEPELIDASRLKNRGIIDCLTTYRMYYRGDFVGVCFMMKTKVISADKIILRQFSRHRASVSTSPKEDVLFVFSLGTDHRIKDLFAYLVL